MLFNTKKKLNIENGIVVIKFNNSLDKLVQYVTKKEYSVIGIYNLTESNQKNKNLALELFSILTSKPIRYLETKRNPVEIIAYSSSVPLNIPVNSTVINYLETTFGDNILNSNLLVRTELELNIKIDSNLLINEIADFLVKTDNREVLNLVGSLLIGNEILKSECETLIKRMKEIGYEIPEIPQKLIFVDKTPSLEIVTSVKILHDQISKITNSIKSDKLPFIELNTIINSLNDISSYYNITEKIKNIKKESSGVILIETSLAKNISLKSGNEIILTTKNFNLSIFTREELIEILEYLDEIVTDDRFDYLRRNITSEIVQRNNIC